MSCPFMDLALILDGSQWKRIPICLRTGSVGDGICGGPRFHGNGCGHGRCYRGKGEGMIVHPPPMALPDGLLTLEDILPATHRGRNITHEMHQRFFIDIPDEESHRIEWRHGCVVGKPGCGKSETIKARAEYAVKKYGKSNINLVYVDDLCTAIEMIDDRPVQYCIIDDAAKSMSSREIHEQTEILGTFNRLRHYFRKFISTESGVFLCEFGWQRWAELDPGFQGRHQPDLQDQHELGV